MFGEELHFPRADQKALLTIAWCPRDQLPKAQAVLDLSRPYPRLCTMSLFSTAFLILRTFFFLVKKQTKSFSSLALKCL